MRAIILAAGEGKRLLPHTEDRPKCMVEIFGKPIIQHILDTMRLVGIQDITVVRGYQAAALNPAGVRLAENPDYACTNMVETLFCAEDQLHGDDVIVSYSDIIYNPTVLNALMRAEGDFSVIIDRKWQELWTLRMDNPLADAETLKLDSEGFILELGKKPKSLEEVQGQYIGLFKISQRALKKVKDFYHQLDRKTRYDGRDFRNMFMTSFIQRIIDQLMPVKAVPIDGGWLEVDSSADLERYTRDMTKKQSLLKQIFA